MKPVSIVFFFEHPSCRNTLCMLLYWRNEKGMIIILNKDFRTLLITDYKGTKEIEKYVSQWKEEIRD
ncbi:hypothetical protein GCM10010969_32680 [Saccharibacillus kuerlensis]|uniref:Uncharacterized protein n=1 Tax=Saccharibacillus kuerlensis TaxID=459527 RepID=A0ABQ2L7C4_9BACL|nr:hypothetical protein GCM10010969_32680 [Saccharibacillus kuerlensis]